MKKGVGEKATETLQKEEKPRKSRKLTFMEYESLMERYAEYFDKFGN